MSVLHTHTHRGGDLTTLPLTTALYTYWIHLQFPDSATHVKRLAVHLFSLLLQVHVGVNLEHIGGIARNHFTVRGNDETEVTLDLPPPLASTHFNSSPMLGIGSGIIDCSYGKGVTYYS